MHVLVLPSWFESPTNPTLGSFFKDQAIALSKLNHQVGIIYPQATSIKKIPTLFRAKHYYCNNKIPTLTSSYLTLPRSFRYNTQKRIKQYEALFLRYCKLYGQPDIIHAHSIASTSGGGAGIAASYLKNKYSIPYILTEHCSDIYLQNYSTKEIPFLVDALNNAHAVIAVSSTLATALQVLSPNIKVDIIGNIIDTNTFKPIQKKHPFYHFVVIAYLRPIKQIDKIIKAFAITNKEIPTTRLTIIGDGEDKKKLQQLANALEVSENINFTGQLNRDGIREILDHTDCLLSTSKYETFGIVIHEALSAGLSIITTPSKGPETTIKELNEITLINDNIDTLAHAMKSKCVAPTPSFKTMLNKHQYIEKHFSEMVIGLKLTATLENAIFAFNSQKNTQNATQ